MKRFVFVLCLLSLPASLCAAKETEIAGYLFAHMTKQDYGRLYYSVSKDGLHWETLNDGKRICDDYRGHPDITRGHDGRYYILGGSATVDLWVSGDLVTWKEFLKFNPDAAKTPGFVPMETIHGAPKMFYDNDRGLYLLTWHTSQNRKDPKQPEHYWSGQRTLYVTSKDLKTFTEPERLFQYDMATIDVIVRKEKNTYYAILKDERYPSFDWPTGKSIRVASSKKLTGPWSKPSDPITPCFREAPTLIPRPDGEGWYLYYEQYPGIQYGLSTAPALDGPWHDVYIMNTKTPENARHGCMIPLTQKQYDDITAAYPSTPPAAETARELSAAAGKPNAETKKDLSGRLMKVLIETCDPRVTEPNCPFDNAPYVQE